MCTCASCEYTDRFGGMQDLIGAPIVMDHKHGWENWPRGDPAGAASSAKAYREHQKHCGSGGLPKPWTFKPGQPPKFSTYGLVMPVQPAPKWLLDARQGAAALPRAG